MRERMEKIILLLTVLLISGCAIGQKTSYEGRSNFNFETEKETKILVAVHDKRPYVQSGNKKPDFTGILKSLYGIPYNVTTSSGKPLSDDFGAMIVNTMRYKGFEASQQQIPFNWSADEFNEKIIGNKKGTNVYYIEMVEWKTETHFSPALHYNLYLSIYNDTEEKIASNKEKGFFYFDKKQPGKENLATATSNILEKLLSVKTSPNSVEIKNNSTSTVSNSKGKEVTNSNNTQSSSIFGTLPKDIQNTIRKKCLKDFPSDFVMQADCAKKQASGWMEIHQ